MGVAAPEATGGVESVEPTATSVLVIDGIDAKEEVVDGRLGQLSRGVVDTATVVVVDGVVVVTVGS